MFWLLAHHGEDYPRHHRLIPYANLANGGTPENLLGRRPKIERAIEGWREGPESETAQEELGGPEASFRSARTMIWRDWLPKNRPRV